MGRIEQAFQLGRAAALAGKARHYSADVDFVLMLREYTKVGNQAELGAALRSSFYAGYDNVTSSVRPE